MKFLKKYFLATFLFSGTTISFSQTFSFDNYTVENGLSQSNISAVVQDKNGYLWLGTGSGVSQFDGKNFVNYSTDDGLSDNNITAILLAKDQSIWFADANGGLTVYRNKKFTAIKSDALPKEKKIFSILETEDGSIWLGTASSGAVQIKNPNGDWNDTKNCMRYSGKDGLSEFVFDVQQDDEGTLWFLTDVGIKFLKNNTNKFDFFHPQGMPSAQITSFLLDKKENFWIGMVNGTVSKFDKQKNTFTHFTKENGLPSAINSSSGVSVNFVTALFEDSKGNVWASVWDGGVCKYNPNENTSKSFTVFNTEKGLSVNKIKSISEDREGNILLGTFGAGLSLYKGEKFISYSKKNGLINNQVWAVTQDKEGKFWFGTSEGISVFNPKETAPEKCFTNYDKIGDLVSNSVRAIKEDNAKNLWIGTWGGSVAKFDASKNKFTPLPSSLNENISNYISCIEIDNKGQIWFGSIEGITIYNPENRETKVIRTVDGLSENDITCIFSDSKGNVWIGTKQRGITKFDGNKFSKLGKENGLAHNSITCITEGKHGTIWIGTEGGGIYSYDGKTFLNYKTKEGLISDFITLMTVDEKNNLWIGTNKGLNRFDYSSNLFYAYGKYDGFTGIETKSNAVLHDKEGNLWFGTVNGVYKYNSKHDVANKLAPVTLITKFRVNQKNYPVAEKVELNYKENNLNFDFIGICLSNPEEVEYVVKMDGYDETWKPATKQAFEIYSNLEPGEYKFNVRACNNSNICNETPAAISIYIKPPFYKTWWFYILISIFGTTLIFSYIKIRERNLRKEKAILEEKVEERTVEVMEKNQELAEKNKDIMASIRYAKRIQDAILPPNELVRVSLPETFILFKPKDIVSGDFYWVNDKKNKVLFGAVDCTGHGVPGAFMSIVGHNMLEKIVSENGLTKPSEILDALDKSVGDTLRQSHTEDVQVKDGMDLTVCCFDKKTNVIEFAGAMNPLYFISNGEFKEIKGDKFPIGGLKTGEARKFTNHEIKLKAGDTIYIFTDGFADQFGGPKGKKLKYQKFKDILMSIQDKTMEEQGQFLEKIIMDWKGSLEQVDDILVIGTRL